MRRERRRDWSVNLSIEGAKSTAKEQKVCGQRGPEAARRPQRRGLAVKETQNGNEITVMPQGLCYITREPKRRRGLRERQSSAFFSWSEKGVRRNIKPPTKFGLQLIFLVPFCVMIKAFIYGKYF